MRLRHRIVNREEDGISLQDFLVRHLDISRRRAKAVLDRREVFVNLRRVWMAHHRLRAGDRVESVSGPPGRRAAAHPILFDDEYYVVVNKRPGLLSNGEDSVESGLRVQLGSETLAAVHRLDRDTSGCLLLARSDEAFDEMRILFRQHDVRKTYRVLVHGRPRWEDFTVDTPIDERRATTHIHVLDRASEASHLQVCIETGRTHQIRKHLAGIGFPVLGDRMYGVRRRGTAKSIRIGRQMLHASELSFRHPFMNRIVRAKAPLPRDFRACLKAHRLT